MPVLLEYPYDDQAETPNEAHAYAHGHELRNYPCPAIPTIVSVAAYRLYALPEFFDVSYNSLDALGNVLAVVSEWPKSVPVTICMTIVTNGVSNHVRHRL